MAVVQRGALKVMFTYKDASGSIGKGEAYLPANTALAAANTAAAALLVNLAALSDCVVQSYNIVASYVENAPAAPAAGSRVENKGIWQFRTAAGKISKMSVPGIKAAYILPSGGIDSANADVGQLVSGITGGAWCDSNGSDITDLYEDYQRFSATGKRQMTTDTNPNA